MPLIFTNEKSKGSPSNNDQRNLSHEKNEKKTKIINIFHSESTSSPSKKITKSLSFASKDTAIKLAVSKYPNFEDLWTKYKQNIDDLKKAKDGFFLGHLKNQNLYQSIFEKLKGVHFGMVEKKIDNSLLINDSKKLVTWNIGYNPYIFIGLISDDVIYENLQVQ